MAFLTLNQCRKNINGIHSWDSEEFFFLKYWNRNFLRTMEMFLESDYKNETPVLKFLFCIFFSIDTDTFPKSNRLNKNKNKRAW